MQVASYLLLKDRFLQCDNEELVHVVVLQEATWHFLADPKVPSDVLEDFGIITHVVG